MSLGGRESITYKEILESACDENGVAYEDLSLAERKRAQRHMQKCLEYAWNFDVWPNLRKFDRRLYHPEYDAAEVVAVGDVRWYSDAYWSALSAGALGTPADGSADWELATLTEKLLAWTDGTSVIGVPKRVTDYDPTKERQGRAHQFTLGRLGLYMDEHAAGELWVEHLPPVPSLKGDDWLAETTYAIGEQCYYEEEGDFFKALVEDTGTTPGTDDDVWERVVIPPMFNLYLQSAVFARMLSAERQTRERRSAERSAEEMLFRCFDIARMMTGTGTQSLAAGNR